MIFTEKIVLANGCRKIRIAILDMNKALEAYKHNEVIQVQAWADTLFYDLQDPTHYWGGFYFTQYLWA